MQLSLALIASAAFALVSAIPQGTPGIKQPCTTTSYTVASFSCPTITVKYLATHTATAKVDCHGCGSIAVLNRFGHGPVCPRPTATLIDSNIKGTTTTEIACLPTPDPYAP